jgi:hypothetical protein
MTRQFNVCDKARVKQYNKEADWHYSGYHRARIMPSLLGKIVLVVDYSNAHGLTYGVVKPNFDGLKGRTESHLEICWVEPDELEVL